MSAYDVGIIGGGPAGLTAASTLARQLHTAIVFDSGIYRNEHTHHMHTVPGWEHTEAQEFRATSRKQIEEKYHQTIEFADVGVQHVQKKSDTSFIIKDNKGKEREVKKVILAIGCEDILPEIEGYKALWKEKIFHCLFCLGYEQAPALKVGVLALQTLAAAPPLALHLAANAAQLSPHVTIFTHANPDLAQQLQTLLSSSTHPNTSPFTIDDRPIARLSRADPTSNAESDARVEFADGSPHADVAFLVHNPLTKPQGGFVQQLGLETVEGMGDIKAEAGAFFQTSCRGVFAAGDCVTPFKVVPHAVMSGNFAGVAAATQVQAERWGVGSMV